MLPQEVLLWTQHRPRPANPIPRDHRRRWYLVIFHGVAADHGGGATEAGFAVDGDASGLFLGFGEELLDFVLRW
jgi:hypothetical protein